MYEIGQEVVIAAPTTPYVQQFKGRNGTITNYVEEEPYAFEVQLDDGKVLGFADYELIPVNVAQEPDEINSPAHYTWLPNGVEVIDVTENLNFCLGNAVKYVLRAGFKHDEPLTDLRKAAWYINREIERLEAAK